MKHLTVLLAALVLVLGVQKLTQAEPPAGIPAWEYRLVQDLGRTDPEIEVTLNKLGADGWELVQLSKGAILKRPR